MNFISKKGGVGMFLTGLILGGVVGVVFMAIFTVSGRSDDNGNY